MGQSCTWEESKRQALQDKPFGVGTGDRVLAYEMQSANESTDLPHFPQGDLPSLRDWKQSISEIIN